MTSSQPLRVQLSELRAVFELIMNYISNSEGEDLFIDKDYFWAIAPGDLFNIQKEPEALGIGRVSESWEHLERLLAGHYDPFPYHLVWLADILRALGTSSRQAARRD